MSSSHVAEEYVLFVGKWIKPLNLNFVLACLSCCVALLSQLLFDFDFHFLGQVGAIRLGISRALQNWEPGFRPPLKEGMKFGLQYKFDSVG